MEHYFHKSNQQTSARMSVSMNPHFIKSAELFELR